MLTRFVEWLDSQPPGRRWLYGLLIGITLLTVPCYVAGLVLLFLGPSGPPPSPAAVMTPAAATATPTPSATYSLPPTLVVPAEQPVDRDRPPLPPATPMLTLPPPFESPTVPAVAATATPLFASPTPFETPTTSPATPFLTLPPPETDTPAPTLEAPTAAPTLEPQPSDTPSGP